MSKSANTSRAEYLFEHAMMHMNSGRSVDAILALQEAILLRNDYHEAYNNRGVFLQLVGNYFDALLNHERAIAIKEDSDYLNNAATALLSMEQYDRALAHLYRALELKPIFSEAHVNIGNILKLLGKVKEAIPHYRSGVAAKPDYVDAKLNLAQALLQDGQYAEGWVTYESRWNSKQLPDRGLKIPAWNGECGTRVLLYGEQGYGDVLQFMRYGSVIAQDYDCEVWLEVRQPLQRIAATVPGIKGVIALGDKVPDVDYCLPMLSAPRVCKTDAVSKIPGNIPYVFPTKDSWQLWEDRLAPLGEDLKVGICWAGHNREGNPIATLIDQRRSTKLSQFAPLSAVPGVKWVSLQRGTPSDQVKNPPQGMTIFDPEDDIGDFYDTACLIQHLNLVITVDTAVVHLAGALGIPTILLSRYDNCWRWLGSARQTPWYPNVYQYRQPSLGEWDVVFQAVANDLRSWVANKGVWIASATGVAAGVGSTK